MNAKNKNEFIIPMEILGKKKKSSKINFLESFKIPDLRSIHFFPVTTYCSNKKPNEKIE